MKSAALLLGVLLGGLLVVGCDVVARLAGF
jgi:hypothetical protein